MAIERRQFLESSLVGNDGLDREITVDTSNQRIALHSTNNPSGMFMANLDDLTNYATNTALSNLGSTVNSQIAYLQQQIDNLQPSSGGGLGAVYCAEVPINDVSHCATSTLSSTLVRIFHNDSGIRLSDIATNYPYYATTSFDVFDIFGEDIYTKWLANEIQGTFENFISELVEHLSAQIDTTSLLSSESISRNIGYTIFTTSDSETSQITSAVVTFFLFFSSSTPTGSYGNTVKLVVVKPHFQWNPAWPDTSIAPGTYTIEGLAVFSNYGFQTRGPEYPEDPSQSDWYICWQSRNMPKLWELGYGKEIEIVSEEHSAVMGSPIDSGTLVRFDLDSSNSPRYSIYQPRLTAPTDSVAYLALRYKLVYKIKQSNV